jgi:hypothetical protein
MKFYFSSKSTGKLARKANGSLAASCSQCRGPKEPAVPSNANADGHDGTEADDADSDEMDGGQIRSISLFIGIIDMLTQLNLKKRLRRIKKCYIDRACREVGAKLGRAVLIEIKNFLRILI